jgi:hypothetical protein
MVLEALDRLGIPQNGNGHKRTDHVPFGLDFLNYQRVSNPGNSLVQPAQFLQN